MIFFNWFNNNKKKSTLKIVWKINNEMEINMIEGDTLVLNKNSSGEKFLYSYFKGNKLIIKINPIDFNNFNKVEVNKK